MGNLYHYCSPQTFLSILQNRTLRLSSLALANDHMEGKLLARSLERVLVKKMGDVAISRLSIERDAIRRVFLGLNNFLEGVGFCLSEESDLLSQWRGYADDGHGFSIGFDADKLRKICNVSSDNGAEVNIERVSYYELEHDEIVEPIVDQIIPLIESGMLRPYRPSLLSGLAGTDNEAEEQKYTAGISELAGMAFNVKKNLLTLKGEAFFEEKEWRIITYLRQPAFEGEVHYRASRASIIPYLDLSFERIGRDLVSEIYLGPKNITPKSVVEQFLARNGYQNVEVRNSSATYR